VATNVPAELPPQVQENLTHLVRELIRRHDELRQRVLRGLSTVAADPERDAGLTPAGLAERLGLPPALLSEEGLHLAVPHLTDEPTPLAPQRAALHIDLDLGAPVRVRVTPGALAAEGEITDVIEDIWSHFGLGSPAVA
jgi:hypothetical protein